MVQLTEAERAYRRGALQAIQFMKTLLPNLTREEMVDYIACWEQRLISGATSQDPKYLGTYLDVVRDEVLERKDVYW